MSLTAGILNLNKPPGMTSRDAVNVVQRLARPAKVGHAGTLDPLASGVLIVCVGAATRLIEYVQRMRKRYRGTFLLGRHSPTEDTDGDVSELIDPPRPSREQIEAAAKRFVGRLMQRPPAYSALKVDGRRAYDLARRGQSVELAARPIDVYSLDVGRFEYPELELDIECSGGTYVRSLGRDLAKSLGTAAVMSALVRTAIGPWSVERAVDPRTLTAPDWMSHVDSLGMAVSELPMRTLSDAAIDRLRKGLSISADWSDDAGEVAAIDGNGKLVAIVVPRGGGLWGPAKNLDASISD